MAVYLIEIPDDSPRSYSDPDVRRVLKEAFDYTNLTVRNLRHKTLKDYDWQQEYDVTMGAG